MPESPKKCTPESELTISQERGIFSETGKCLIEAPPQEMLKKYEGNSRVEYFPAQVTDPLKAHYPVPDADVEAMQGQNQLLVLYNLSTLDQLGAHVAQSLNAGERVGIRGTVCSIDGDIDEGDIHIKDLLKALDDGTEKEGDKTLIVLLSKEEPTIHYRTTQWLQQGAQELREKFAANPNLQRKLFPILLVYRLEKLTPLTHYKVQLPASQEDRAKVIIKAYILDYPKSKREVS